MKFLFLGNYSNAGLAGFLKNPEDDRRAAISAMVEKSGGKFIDLQFLGENTTSQLLLRSQASRMLQRLKSLWRHQGL